MGKLWSGAVTPHRRVKEDPHWDPQNEVHPQNSPDHPLHPPLVAGWPRDKIRLLFSRIEIGNWVSAGILELHENGGFCEAAPGCQVNFHSQPKMFQISKKLRPEHRVPDLTLDNFHSWIFSIYRSGIFPFLTQDLRQVPKMVEPKVFNRLFLLVYHTLMKWRLELRVNNTLIFW